MDGPREFYIYTAFRPDGSPCYVGKGKGNRWRVHLRRSHNIVLRRIIAKSGGEIPIVVVRSNLTEAEAFEIERAFIAAIGRGQYGPLVNMTDGGEGMSGHKPSLESIEKRVSKLRGRPRSKETIEKIAKANMGKKRSEETKAKQRGRIASPETRAKQRAAKLGKRQSSEHRAAIGASHRGKKRDPAWGAKISAAKMGHKVSEVTKAKLRSWTRSPELCAKIAVATKQAMNTPSVQAKLHAPRT